MNDSTARSGSRKRPDSPTLHGSTWPGVTVLLLLEFAALSPARASFRAFDPPGTGAAYQGTSTSIEDPSTVEAFRLVGDSRISLDGRLDDPVWTQAQGGSGFRSWDPERGAASYQPTVFKVAYDDHAVYFGIACSEPDPKRITKMLSRRDRPSDSDAVTVYIDPYFDRTTGYYFQVNPLGVQTDGSVDGDGNEDDSWDGVWETATYQDADGWYAEIRLPFSSIRYRSDVSTWGLDVFRQIHWRGQTDAWVVWDRDKAGFVSRFGQIAGLQNIPAPRQLEVTPYTLVRAKDPSIQGPEKLDRFQNMGADLKYGVTSDLTLNAAVQPDFGQVESDPANLNLSPYETFYQEKRPFFTEGAQYLYQPAFNVFYSRRIGTGDENSRIRAAAKLTGKTESGISIGALAATTDITGAGQTHNLLKTGTRQANYFLGRVGREFGQGNRYFHLMQTAVVRPDGRDAVGDRESREAYVTGGDFGAFFKDRRYGVFGSFVGSVLDPERLAADPAFRPAKSYGTGGDLQFRREGRTLSGSINGRWVSTQLDLNDLGYLRSPDYMASNLWLGYRYNPRQQGGFVQRGNLNGNLNLAWTYSGREGYDLHSGERIWSYGRGHRQISSSNINGWTQLRGFWTVDGMLAYQLPGTQRDETRSTVVLENGSRVRIPGGGPLMGEPDTYTGRIGIGTDSRRKFTGYATYYYSVDTARNLNRSGEIDVAWNQSSAVRHELGFHLETRTDDTQHIDNYENPGHGIGGVSYVFGRLTQRTLDATLRSSLLFNRDQSLEIYAQPYLTVGSLHDARELVRPDSYELVPYGADGFDVRDHEFRYAAVNLNAVYRWEYRPGSALFLVWTHARSSYDERGTASDPTAFGTRLSPGTLFRNEPENVFLVKITYWMPV